MVHPTAKMARRTTSGLEPFPLGEESTLEELGVLICRCAHQRSFWRHLCFPVKYKGNIENIIICIPITLLSECTQEPAAQARTAVQVGSGNELFKVTLVQVMKYARSSHEIFFH
jgi:hypothetical protein